MSNTLIYNQYSLKIDKIANSDPYRYYNVNPDRKTKICANCGLIYKNRGGRATHERSCLSYEMQLEINILLGKMQKILFREAKEKTMREKFDNLNPCYLPKDLTIIS
jgi:hypothetical protein